MLGAFLQKLRNDYPEARFDLTEPVTCDSDAAARVETLHRHYVELTGCADDLRKQEALMKFRRELNEAMEADPEKTQSVVNKVLAGGFVAASLADVLFVEGATHAAHAADAAEATVHILEGIGHFATAGALLLASFKARRYFRKKHDASRAEIEELAERALLNGCLAEALMTQDRIPVAQALLSDLAAETEH